MSTYQGVAHKSRWVPELVDAVDGEIEWGWNGRDDKNRVSGEIYKNVDSSKILGMALPGVGGVPAPREEYFLRMPSLPTAIYGKIRKILQEIRQFTNLMSFYIQ